MGQEKLSLFYIYRKVLFPSCVIFFKTSSKRYRNIKEGDLILALPAGTLLDVLFARKRIATLSEVSQITYEKNSYAVHLKGISRVRVTKIYGFTAAGYELVEEEDSSYYVVIDDLRKRTQELIFLINVKESDKLIHLLNFINSLNQLTDFISNYFVVKYSQRLAIFNELNAQVRAHHLIAILDQLIKRFKDKREKASS